MDTPDPPDVVAVDHLTRRFGDKLALDRVSLRVPRGTVFGLIGPNGAGKTTLIRHLLGVLRAQEGSVRVFGKDPVADPVGVLAQVGYLSEDNDLPGWMRVDELIRYVRAFYPGWSDDLARELLRDFRLDPSARVGNLSKGQRARAGLLVALAYRPPLLILDEPSSGLDPLVRRDILGAIVRTIADEGRTVLFSSHLLDEVERVADQVAMIHAGRIVLCASLEQIQEGHRKLTVRFEESRPAPPRLEGVLTWEGAGREWTAVWAGRAEVLHDAVGRAGGAVVEERPLPLDDIFYARMAAQEQGR